MTTTAIPADEQRTAEIAAILADDEWTRRWASCRNVLRDPYGNTVAIIDQGDSIRVEFAYAVPGGCMEILDLEPRHGAHRIARIIAALAAPAE